MAISDQVRSQLFQQATEENPAAEPVAIRIPTTRGGNAYSRLAGPRAAQSGKGSRRGIWTPEEHLRFLEALDEFPWGPWKSIAGYVGNKTARQAMTHGQKYRQKIERRRRGLKKVVRDLQFATAKPVRSDDCDSDSDSDSDSDNDNDNDNGIAHLRIASNPTGLSDEAFDAFVASLDLSKELELDLRPDDESDESPLVVANATISSDMTNCALGGPEAQASACLLPLTTPHQDVHHWVVMDRADASSEEFSAVLNAAFHAGDMEADYQTLLGVMPLPEQPPSCCYPNALEELHMEPLLFDPVLDGPDSLELDGFQLR